VAHEKSETTQRGAKRTTIYDTNGNADPFFTYELTNRSRSHLSVPIFFHGRNDLGLATANSLFAVYGGVDAFEPDLIG
jgi:isopropylmalate/homocitrate/citramalate synthase